MNIALINSVERTLLVCAKPYSQTKGLRRQMQLQFHKQGLYGLEFWADIEQKSAHIGVFRFSVLSPYGADYASDTLRRFKL